MGTIIGVDVRDLGLPPEVLDAVFAYLHDVDRRFSMFKPDSEISRLGREELTEAEASPDVRVVLELCDDLWRTSGGYFDVRTHRPDGRLDPSGLVKGWSIEEAARKIEAAGGRNFSINAGGDVVARGEPEAGRAWRVGIRHPRRADRVAAVLAIHDGAVATSGTYERGDHIIDPHTGRPPWGLLSVTVVGPSLTYADAYATTAFAMGPEGLAWVAGHGGYGAYGITPDERAIWTSEVELLLA
jgi:thiamine biosynthesis lipoprotein